MTSAWVLPLQAAELRIESPAGDFILEEYEPLYPDEHDPIGARIGVRVPIAGPNNKGVRWYLVPFLAARHHRVEPDIEDTPTADKIWIDDYSTGVELQRHNKDNLKLYVRIAFHQRTDSNYEPDGPVSSEVGFGISGPLSADRARKREELRFRLSQGQAVRLSINLEDRESNFFSREILSSFLARVYWTNLLLRLSPEADTRSMFGVNERIGRYFFSWLERQPKKLDPKSVSTLQLWIYKLLSELHPPLVSAPLPNGGLLLATFPFKNVEPEIDQDLFFETLQNLAQKSFFNSLN